MRGTVSNAGFDICGRSILSRAQWRAIGEALQLSARELQIVQCVFDGASEVSIATELGISAHTVHAYVRRLYHKLGICDRCELVVRVFAAYITLGARQRHGVAVSRAKARSVSKAACPLQR